jgi:hypothetical protein
MNFLLRFYLNSKSKYHNSCAISEIFLQSTLILTAFTLNIFSKCVFCFFILNNNKHLFLSLFTDQVSNSNLIIYVLLKNRIVLKQSDLL